MGKRPFRARIEPVRRPAGRSDGRVRHFGPVIPDLPELDPGRDPGRRAGRRAVRGRATGGWPAPVPEAGSGPARPAGVGGRPRPGRGHRPGGRADRRPRPVGAVRQRRVHPDDRVHRRRGGRPVAALPARAEVLPGHPDAAQGRPRLRLAAPGRSAQLPQGRVRAVGRAEPRPGPRRLRPVPTLGDDPAGRVRPQAGRGGPQAERGAVPGHVRERRRRGVGDRRPRACSSRPTRRSRRCSAGRSTRSSAARRGSSPTRTTGRSQ